MDIQKILKDHLDWLNKKPGGERAGLRGANLREAGLRSANLWYADLRGADLWYADLREANLRGANLWYADLRGADLRGADLREADLQNAYLREAGLRGADLREADLQNAYLRGADLRGADLRGADLRGANLQNANLRDANLPHFQICPEEGSFIAWKSARGEIVKLLIPEHAKRTSSLIGRKCRASEVIVLEVNGSSSGLTAARGTRDINTIYEPGKPTFPDSYDPDIRVECSHGIHFFMTKKEAQEW